MVEQRIIWTALPVERIERDSGGFLRLSVFVAPRLAPDGGRGKLGEFPDWTDWSATAATIGGFEVEVDGLADAIPAQAVDPSPIVTGLWTRLFDPSLPVQAFGFEDLTSRTIVSYPVADTLSHLRASYQSLLLASANRPPELGQTLQALQPFAIDLSPALSDRIRGHMREEQARNSADLPGQRRQGSQHDAWESTARALLFHHTPDTEPVQLPEQGDELRALFDFHNALAMLGDYPALMRALGLVVDIEFPADALQAYSSSAAPLRLRVRPRWQPEGHVLTMQSSLWTAYLWDGRSFSAAPHPAAVPDLVDGLLNLRDDEYALHEVDVDGAIIKQAYAASTLTGGQSRRAPDAPQREAPAALRSGGFALSRRDRALRLRGSFTRAVWKNAQLEGGGDVDTFFADDLTRGFVVDVWDSWTGQWNSLFRRVGNYEFTTDQYRLTLEDEGFSQTAVTQSAVPQAGAPPDLRLHETLWSWDGWSLAAPRPGRSILSGSGSGQLPETVENKAVTALPLSVSFRAAPHSLPRLRFGARYRMRARAVDLAGNARRLTDAGEGAVLPASGAQPYLRFDPVLAPTVALCQDLDTADRPGETVDRLVIRSTNSDPALDTEPTAQQARRHLVPSRTSVQMCERHGVLDDATGRLRADASGYAMLDSRDAADIARDAAGTPMDPSPWVTSPWLPDPVSRGAALRNLPGAGEGTLGDVGSSGALEYVRIAGAVVRPGNATRIRFGEGAGWPELEGIAICLADGDGPPEWDPATRRLTVRLKKAETADVDLSSFVDPEDLRVFGVWSWLREVIEGRSKVYARQPDVMLDLGVWTTHVAQYSLEGALWVITPARTLSLVHAVQQPLRAPAPTFVALRPHGSTSARLTGEVAVHGKSTGLVDIRASWQEPVDDPKEPGPRIVSVHDHVDTIALREVTSGLVRNGDRYVGNYVAERDVVVCEGHAFPRHEFGDTRHRMVTYELTATSRFADYFDAAAPGGFSRSGETILVNVPASTRPAPPAVEYVLPTFGWQRNTDTNLVASMRLGGGLRVYLGRGWYSSGEGELLGVVLRPTGRPNPDNAEREAMKSFFTQWGIDPIWRGRSLPPLPTGSSFPRAVARANSIPLLELGDGTAAVAAHEIHYDEQRGRWFCDIEVDHHNTYYPFIRLALARYQPSAIDGCELSPVILASFAQLAPDRTLVVTHDPDDASLMHVVVSGFTFGQATERALGVERPVVTGTRVKIEVEKRLPGLDDEIGWTTTGDATITQLDIEDDNTVLWRGTVTLPNPRVPDSYRIVVREYESHPVDQEVGLTVRQAALRYALLDREDDRLVYADGIVV